MSLRVRFIFWTLAIAAMMLRAPLCARAQSTAPATDVAEVPASVLDDIGQYAVIPEDEPPDADKIRRFNRALRLCTSAEHEFAGAPNLYRVESLKLTAAQNLAVLDDSDENRARILDIANLIMASDAPDDAKIPADVLLTQSRIAQGSGAQHAVSSELDRFMHRHNKTAPATARIYLAMLYKQNGMLQAAANVYDELRAHYLDEPGVRAFLRVTTGLDTDKGLTFKATLTRLDGSKLVLPRDLFGKMAIIQWYSAKSPMCIESEAEARKFYDKYQDDAEIVSVSVDRSLAETEQFVKDQKMNWTVTFSGQGRGDPLAVNWGVTAFPYYWFVGPNGLNFGNDFYLWSRNGDWADAAAGFVLHSRALNQHLNFFASGTFLVTRPPDHPITTQPATTQPIALPVLAADSSAKAIPGPAEDAIESLVVYPGDSLSNEQTLMRYQAVLDLGAAIEAAYPKAADLYQIRNRELSALAGIAWIKRDKASWDHMVDAAIAAIKSDMPTDAKLLAEFVLLERRIFVEQLPDADAAAAARDLMTRYSPGPAKNAGLLAAAMLSLEYGDDKLRADAVTAMYADLDAPFARMFLHRVLHMSPDKDRPFVATLKRTDGTTIHIPDDFHGKPVLISFCSKQGGTGLPTAASMKARPQFAADKFATICISLDATPPDADALSAAYGLPQMLVCSGMRRYDPTALRFGVTGAPQVWCLDKNGDVFGDETYGDYGWALVQALERPLTEHKPPHAAPQPRAPTSRPVITPVDIAYSKDKLELTGDESAWANIPSLPLPLTHADHSSVKLVWREDGLYGLLTAQDDDIKVVFDRPWQGDALELFFEKDVEGTWERSSSSAQYAFSPDPDGKEGPAQIVIAYGSNDPELEGKIECRWHKTDGGYVLKFFIPAAVFVPATMTPGARLGFNFALDEKGKPTEQFFVNKDDHAAYSNPVTWGLIELKK